MTFEGPKGNAYVYKGARHDWVLEFWPAYSRKRPRKTVKRTFSNSAKHAAIIVAKQMAGVFE